MINAGGPGGVPRSACCRVANGDFLIGKRHVQLRPGDVLQPPMKLGRPTRGVVPRLDDGCTEFLRVPNEVDEKNFLMLPKIDRSARDCAPAPSRAPANVTGCAAGAQSRSVV